MFVQFNFISGMSVGIEWHSKQEMGEDDEGWYLVIDLLILRILIDK